MHLMRTEHRRLFRQPFWIVLLIVAAALFYGAEIPTFHASIPEGFTDFSRSPLVSVGEWGRLILLFSTSVVGALFALFVSLMATGLLHSDAAHREVLWSTAMAGSFKATVTKLAAVSTFATALIVVGATSAWLNPANREMLVLAGWAYVPLYILFLWLQTVVWTAASFAIYYATHSRWLPIGVITGLAALWFVIGQGQHNINPTLGILHRSFLSWGFLEPHFPFGLIPPLLALQGVLLIGVASLCISIAHWARRTYPEWRSIRPRFGRTAVLVSTLLALGCGVGSTLMIDGRMAPSSIEDVYSYFFDFDSLMPPPWAIWDNRGVLLLFPSPFNMLRLPTRLSTPEWIHALNQASPWRRYDGVGRMIIARDGSIYTPAHQSLLIGESEKDKYPGEFEGAVRRLRQEVDPLVQRAEIWHEPMEILILPPHSGVQDFSIANETLFVAAMPRTASNAASSCAWILTEASGVTGPDRLYLYLYLLASSDPAEVEASLAALRATVAGTFEPPKDKPWLANRPMSYWDSDWSSEEAASHILEQWKRGERIGHQVNVQSLLEEGAK